MFGDVLDDLEFFLDVADDAIEERDRVILELVRTLEAVVVEIVARHADTTLTQYVADCRAVIAKARNLVKYDIVTSSAPSSTGLAFLSEFPDPSEQGDSV